MFILPSRVPTTNLKFPFPSFDYRNDNTKIKHVKNEIIAKVLNYTNPLLEPLKKTAKGLLPLS
jgi:hypothetical protein